MKIDNWYVHGLLLVKKYCKIQCNILHSTLLRLPCRQKVSALNLFFQEQFVLVPPRLLLRVFIRYVNFGIIHSVKIGDLSPPYLWIFSDNLLTNPHRSSIMATRNTTIIVVRKLTHCLVACSGAEAYRSFQGAACGVEGLFLGKGDRVTETNCCYGKR